jgi:hypothetical protein
MDAVFLGEARHDIVLVLPNPPRNIGCHSGIEVSVGLAGEHVDVEHRIAIGMDRGLRRD